MTVEAPLPVLELTIAMAVAGFAAGLAYFASLRRTATLLAAGRGWPGALSLTLARFAAAALFLAFAASLGAISLLAAFGGFLLARAVAVRAARRTG